ncbi:MAG: hypothetical protein P8Z73_05320, partial [Desulfobacteraceae bacterium]
FEDFATPGAGEDDLKPGWIKCDFIFARALKAGQVIQPERPFVISFSPLPITENPRMKKIDAFHFSSQEEFYIASPTKPGPMGFYPRNGLSRRIRY